MQILSTLKIRELLCEAFSNSEIPEKVDKLMIGDIEEWDSLGNFNLLLLVEDEYGIKFSMDEMTTIKSVQQLLCALTNKSS